MDTLTVTNEDLGFGEWEVNTELRIDDSIWSFGPVNLNDTFTKITGVYHYTFANFKLEPRWMSDFEGYVASQDTGDTDDTDPVITPTDLLLSEVVDHASVYQARFVEIANVSANAVTLDDYTIQRYSNGGTNAVNVALSGTLSAGDVWVIANSQAEFEVEYGAGVADQFNATISGTGDDTYVLAHLGNVADIYGEIGVDGDTELWFYEDSVATRNAGVTTPNTVWTASEWTITPGSAAATPGVR